jgi:hypothetical protein
MEWISNVLVLEKLVLIIACIQVVHDIADNILNHTYIYIVEIYSTQVSNIGKRSSHMHVEV